MAPSPKMSTPIHSAMNDINSKLYATCRTEHTLRPRTLHEAAYAGNSASELVNRRPVVACDHVEHSDGMTWQRVPDRRECPRPGAMAVAQGWSKEPIALPPFTGLSVLIRGVTFNGAGKRALA